MVHLRIKNSSLMVKYDKRMISEAPTPPIKEGAYSDIFGKPLSHLVFLGDYVPGEKLLRRISSELEIASSERIDASSLFYIVGTGIHGGRQFKSMHEKLDGYKENDSAMNIVVTSYGNPISISYFNYDCITPLKNIGLMFTLPTGEKSSPEMVFLLEDRLRDTIKWQENVDEFSIKPSKVSDNTIFRKSFIKDYMARHNVPYIDLAER
jgi:hypothetical protein